MIEALYSACLITVIYIDEFYKKQEPITATGFFVQNKFDQICFVTNRHVLDPDFRHEDRSRKEWKIYSLTIEYKTKDTKGLPTINQKSKIKNIEEIIFSKNNNNDIGCIINPKGIFCDSQNCVLEYTIPYKMIADINKFLTHLEICDAIAFTGFPAWYNSIDGSPIFRMGNIASDPRIDYNLDIHKIYGQAICYEGFSFEGNSGGPVFLKPKGFKSDINSSVNLISHNYCDGLLIGINAGHIEEFGEHKNEKNHVGLSYFYKSSAILDLIDTINWLVVI